MLFLEAAAGADAGAVPSFAGESLGQCANPLALDPDLPEAADSSPVRSAGRRARGRAVHDSAPIPISALVVARPAIAAVKHGAKCALLMGLAGCATFTKEPSPSASLRHEASPRPEANAVPAVSAAPEADALREASALPEASAILEGRALLAARALREDSDLDEASPPQEASPSQEGSARRVDRPRHEAGSTFIQTRAFYGVPILHKSFYWDGQGEVYDSGLGVHAGKFVSEQFAVGIGSNLTTWWTPGSDVYSVELEMLLRWFPVHDWPVFINGTGGYQLANHDIPPGGTVWNFTFSWGLGVEWPIGNSTHLITAADYHHISNALGRQNDRNPSQNEVRFWVGVEWNF
jgi:hypothetical protein